MCIDKEGTNIKIIDFGAAKKLDQENKVILRIIFVTQDLSQMKVICGTPEFLSPEVVNYEFIDVATGEDWGVKNV